MQINNLAATLWFNYCLNRTTKRNDMMPTAFYLRRLLKMLPHVMNVQKCINYEWLLSFSP